MYYHIHIMSILNIISQCIIDYIVLIIMLRRGGRLLTVRPTLLHAPDR